MPALLLALLGMAGMAAQRGPVNRLDFVTGQVAGMMRIDEGEIVCVASINGRPSGRGDLSICYILTGAGGPDIVRRAGAGAQFEALLSIRPDGTRPPERSDMGVAVATASALVTVRPDGSLAACAEGRGRVLRRVPGLRDPPPLCELYLPGTERVFADAPAGSAPRSARLYLGYYLRRP
jgi:hypothetical protein